MNKAQRAPTSSGMRAAAIVAGVIAILYLAREVLIPLAFAITLTFVLTPAVSWLQKTGLKRVPAVLIVMAISLLTAGAVGFVLIGQVIDVVNQLQRYEANINSKIQSIRKPGHGALADAAARVKNIGKDLSGPSEPATPQNPNSGATAAATQPAAPMPVQIVEAPLSEFQYLRDLAGSFFKPLGEIGIVLIFTVFILIEQRDLRNRLFRLVGLDKLSVMTQAFDDATQRVSRYILLQTMVNTGFGLVCACGLYLIGVPYAALWGTFAAILRIVPYVGALVGLSLPLLLSLAVFNGWAAPLSVFFLYASADLLTSNFVEPWLYGIHTGISSLALLLTTVFWAVLWGPAGLILFPTPLTVCVVVLGRYVPQFSFLHILLGDDPSLAAEARIYQRLLAMDDQEARAVANLYLKENTLAKLYDAVLMPALAMAEQDRHKGALDAAREEFVFLSIKEMLSEFSEMAYRSANGNVRNGRPAEPQRVSTPRIRVLCLPVSDDADEIASVMLAQLLERSGYAAISFPVDASVQHSVGLLSPDGDDVFCISALPPFAFARAISLSQQLRSRFPQTKIVIGVWGFTGDVERALHRFQEPHPDKLVGNLADALKFVIESDPSAIRS